MLGLLAPLRPRVGQLGVFSQLSGVGRHPWFWWAWKRTKGMINTKYHTPTSTTQRVYLQHAEVVLAADINRSGILSRKRHTPATPLGIGQVLSPSDLQPTQHRRTPQ